MTTDSTSVPDGAAPDPSASAPDHQSDAPAAAASTATPEPDESSTPAATDVPASAGSAALVPTPATPEAPEGRGVTGTGPRGRTRSPIGGWLLLIPTFGIYYLFWYHNINRELRDYDPSVKVKPGLAVLSLFIPLVGLVSIYNTGNRIRQAQATSGGAPEASGLLGLLASIVFALNVPYYSAQLNRVWRA
jgi:hypothetical protein